MSTIARKPLRDNNLDALKNKKKVLAFYTKFRILYSRKEIKNRAMRQNNINHLKQKGSYTMATEKKEKKEKYEKTIETKA